jgi:predicted metal-dependent hydrolase
MKLFLDNYEFEVNHHANKRIKRFSLVFESKTKITIKTPLKIKAHQVKEIFYKNKDWILNTINKVPVRNKFDFLVDAKLPFLGKSYPIKFIDNEIYKNVKIQLKDEGFLIYHNSLIHKEYDNFLDGIKQFYSFNVNKIIDPIFEIWIKKISLDPQKIGYRFAKTRWGSCSGKNNISLNYMLLQFSVKTIEYVVIHELCHIQEKNHSKRFWNLVSRYMPDYKKQEEELKKKVL